MPENMNDPGERIKPAGRKRTAAFEADGALPSPPPAPPPAPAPTALEAVSDGDSGDPMIGGQVAGYTIEKRLGRGDRVHVYLAYHAELGTPVTIKFLKPEFCQALAGHEQEFFRQMERRKQLLHPNILQVRGAQKHEGRYFLVTEYVEGRRLEDILETRGAFPPAEGIAMAKQLCAALASAHAQGFTVCAINPFNTLVDKTGMAKAAVLAFDHAQETCRATAFDDTSTTAALYLAPEVFRSRGDARADVYALGCMIFRMLCGKPPFAGSDREELARRHCEDPVPDPRTWVPTLPGNLASLVMRMLAKEPEQRPADMQEVIRLLDADSAAVQTSGPGAKRLSHGLVRLLAKMEELDASDLHLKVKAPPVYRIRGETHRTNATPFSAEQLQALIFEVLTPEQIAILQDKCSIDLSFTIEEVGRFRINAFRQRGSLSACVRRVNAKVPTMDELLLPRALAKVATFKDGMVLTTGATGSGKTTTLAIIIDLINQSRRGHILTIEDPIEFMHEDKSCIVTQREIGTDTPDFLNGLRDGLRQDPDVILIGELRDMETMETALSASETGHMVLGTLHANTTTEAIQRILNFFPFDRHENLHHLLGNTLRAIIAQRIVPGCHPQRARVAAVELLFVNDIIRQCITDGEEDRIYRQFEVFAHEGFQSFNMSLYQLVTQGLVDRRIALRESPKPKELEGFFSSSSRITRR